MRGTDCSNQLQIDHFVIFPVHQTITLFKNKKQKTFSGCHYVEENETLNPGHSESGGLTQARNMVIILYNSVRKIIMIPTRN